MKKITKHSRKIIIFIVISWLLLFIFLPNLIIVIVSFMTKDDINFIKFNITLYNYKLILDKLYINIFIYSLYISLITTFICFIIGYLFSWCLIKISYYYRSIMLFFFFLPFWVNSLIRIFSLKNFFSIHGYFNSILIHLKLINHPIHIMYTSFAVILGLVYILLPFMIIPIYSSLEKLDMFCIEAAKDLGAKSWKIFIYIVLPLTLPGIISGCLLVFLPAIGMFYISDLMGGAKNLLIGNIIKNQFLNIRDWPLGAALSNVVILVTGIFLILYYKLIKIFHKKEF
ncbi:spermidine/putrescine ABC transporter permease PotB [Enterobacteriaceae endosymbiont of Plateumaris braccata]|uniref:spermidine/putrescine ABC transporter permease PotB n=1 Tax=Enterobacteriaceae endosymbiont of Plateumaris braccata TaxID=2675793 RepID=UPI001448C9D7|nr:spermidine/putrescine ABC transporter permease PotB [Enterobacteriaceae endosymbiont of Plateumaris braccata]QJC28382.1 spermidine/putrescine ABC transporter permease PotB [Enterobacteriaceae endosymbiont of Plateumaris braccata]